MMEKDRRLKLNSLKGWIWTVVLLAFDAVLFTGGGDTTERVNVLLFIFSMAGSCFVCFLGEWIVRRRFHAKKASKLGDGGRLEALFSEVHHEAAKVSPFFKIWPAEIYVVPGQEINAFAVGSRTVMVTEASLQQDAGEQKALLAHELGHLAAGHGCMSLMIAANILVLSIGYVITQFFAVVLAVILSACCFIVGGQGSSSFFAAGNAREVARGAFDTIQGMYLTGLERVIAWLKRGCECDADEFAASCGCGSLLRQVFMQLASQESEGSGRLRERLFGEHFEKGEEQFI